MPQTTSQQVARWCIVAGVLLGALLRVLNLANVELRTVDEGTYTAQAAALLDGGLPGLRRLVIDYVNDPDRLFPAPSRIGYTGPIAGLMALTGRSDYLVGAWISTLASIAGLAVIALIGERFFAPWVGVVATFLLAVFPPDLVIARRAWSDAWVGCLAYVLLYCTFALARGDRSRPVAVIFLAACSIFVMTKEISTLLCGMCVLWIIVSQRRSSIPIVAATAVTGLVSLAFLSWAIGGAPTLWDIQSQYGTLFRSNPYAIDYQSGPPYWLLKSFWIMSPWTILLAAIGLVTVPFFGAWRDRRAAAALSGFVLVVLAIPVVVPGALNLRYASPAFGPLCILAAAALFLGINTLKERLAAPVIPVVVALGCVGLVAALRDYRYFDRWFVTAGTLDLSVRMVFATAGAEGELPPLGASLPRATTPEYPSRIAQDALNQSLALYQQGRFDDSIAAARRALAAWPGYAEAHNNIAAAYASMGRWNEAIQAAEAAIRLKPDFQLAKNNLAWAQAEKAKGGAAGK